MTYHLIRSRSNCPQVCRGRVAISSRGKEELTVQTRGSLFNWSYLRDWHCGLRPLWASWTRAGGRSGLGGLPGRLWGVGGAIRSSSEFKPEPKIDGRGLPAKAATRAVEGHKSRQRPQHAGGCGGTDGAFLLRTACVSSVPTDASHTARAAMLGQFRWLR